MVKLEVFHLVLSSGATIKMNRWSVVVDEGGEDCTAKINRNTTEKQVVNNFEILDF